MKFLFSTLVLLFISLYSFSQTTNFYKDQYLSKKCKEEKASYKKVEEVNEDGKTSIKVYKLGREDHLIKENYYLNGKAVGHWKSYDLNGKLIEDRNFDLVKYDLELPVDIYSPDPLGADGFRSAQFGDSIVVLFKFLGQNIRYPAEAKNAGISGKVYINLIIDEEGNAYPYCILRGVDPLIDYEAWRVLSDMPKWKPAILDGQAIKSSYALPINFILK